MSSRSRADQLRWSKTGTGIFERALKQIPRDELRQPTYLEGWTRAHVVAHVTSNALGLRNLLVWAQTGVETPMYSSPGQRVKDIDTGAALRASQLTDNFAQSVVAFDEAIAHLAPDAWSFPVRTAQGRLIPVSEVPWLRAREVMVHSVDLLVGVRFEHLPEDFLLALIEDVVAKRSGSPEHPPLDLTDGERSWSIGDAGGNKVTGSTAEIAAYLTGRNALLGPPLPNWL